MPSATGPLTIGRSDGSNEPSASMMQTMSLVAASSPVWQAAPNPRCGTSTTVAPCSAAIRAEPSVEPLSATIGRYPAGICVSSRGSAPASLRHGRTTSMVSMAPTLAAPRGLGR